MATVVAKIGTSSITDRQGVIDEPAIARFADQVAELRRRGHRVVVVTSGAISAGVPAMGLRERPSDLPTLQALAAVGQPRLMQVYDVAFGRHALVPAQVLFDPHDFVDRRQYLHARQTLGRLLELGSVPVVNENDAVADDEIRFGDNDRLAALVAHLVRADVLVLLTDLEGLYTADPRRHDDAALVHEVGADDPMMAVDAGGTGSTRGSGGMASKLTAARIASWSGVRAVIAAADRPEVLLDAVAGTPGVGTVFHPHARRLSARKLWIAFAGGPEGRLVIDDGAREALVERGTSLLPAGVVAVEGDFEQGETIDVVDQDGVVVARGMAAADAATLRGTAGRRTADLPADVAHEAVHRDDLVLMVDE